MAKFKLENFVIFMTGKGVFPQLSRGLLKTTSDVFLGMY